MIAYRKNRLEVYTYLHLPSLDGLGIYVVYRHTFTIVLKKVNIWNLPKNNDCLSQSFYSLLKTFRAISRRFEARNGNNEAINIQIRKEKLYNTNTNKS